MESSTEITPHTSQAERQKPGPKKGAQKKAEATLTSLMTRLQNLEDLVIRMAHNSGTSSSVIRASGLKPYDLKPQDMNKFKVG